MTFATISISRYRKFETWTPCVCSWNHSLIKPSTHCELLVSRSSAKIYIASRRVRNERDEKQIPALLLGGETKSRRTCRFLFSPMGERSVEKRSEKLTSETLCSVLFLAVRSVDTESRVSVCSRVSARRRSSREWRLKRTRATNEWPLTRSACWARPVLGKPPSLLSSPPATTFAPTTLLSVSVLEFWRDFFLSVQISRTRRYDKCYCESPRKCCDEFRSRAIMSRVTMKSSSTSSRFSNDLGTFFVRK